MSEPAGESFSDVAALYLGNILYALEVTALSLESEQKADDAAFYRGIARKLATMRGRESGAAPPTGPSGAA